MKEASTESVKATVTYTCPNNDEEVSVSFSDIDVECQLYAFCGGAIHNFEVYCTCGHFHQISRS